MGAIVSCFRAECSKLMCDGNHSSALNTKLAKSNSINASYKPRQKEPSLPNVTIIKEQHVKKFHQWYQVKLILVIHMVILQLV